jgi:hypothetical protein
VGQLEDKGLSPKAAKGEAAFEGRRKYGKQGMADMAAAGKKRAAAAKRGK